MKRVIAALLAAVLSLCLQPGPAFAQQDETGTIRIVVVDQTTKSPIELARVVLDGPVVTSELTDKKGEVIFTDVPDGIYRARVLDRGYQSITSSSFEVINGNYVTVSVALALSTELKIIGTVTAHSDAAISSSSIGPDSAQRKLSSDLADALNKLSGVSVQTSSDDSDSEQTISLEGHDASQTALTLDGIPLNAPGSAGNLGMFASDLFMGAGVRMGPQLGGLGGGVNFTTLEPTLSYESYLSMAAGTRGRYNYSLAETGSDGKLGFAVMAVDRVNPSWLDGLTYRDASGLDYDHDGDSTIGGEFAKFRYEVSDSQTVSGMFLGSDRSTEIACSRIQNGVPCGYGPGNYSYGSVGLFSLTDDVLTGNGTSIQTSLYSMSSTSLNDELARYVDGVASPIGSSGLNQTKGFTLSATLPAAQRHTISVLAYGSWGSQQTFPINAAGEPYYTNDQHSSYTAAQVTDSIHSNSHLTLLASAGLTQATGGFGGTLASAGATWHPNKRDTYSLSYALTGSPATSTRSTLLSDPDNLRFTCDGSDSVAFGNAPGASPEASSSSSTRVAYTHAISGGSVTVQLYRQVQNNVLLPADVNGSILVNNGTLTPSYLAAVQEIFQSPAGCGATTPFSPSQLYFSTPIAGVERLYQGGSITGYVTLGNLVLQPFYDETVSQAISNSPYIDNPYSITVSGQQLPNVPLQRWGVVADYKAPRSAVEWLADAQYSGRNNPNNLPAYTQFDAAVNTLFTSGSLTLAATNIFNTDAGVFSSVQGAIPYYTASGFTVPTLARPLVPRSYAVTYSVKFGPGALGNTHLAQNIEPRGDGRYGGGPGGRGPGGGGFRSAITPLPTSPPADPFAVSDNGELCPADSHAMAIALAAQLKAYVAQIEAAKTAAGYPATMPAPQIPNVTVTYHGLGNTYALTISPHFQNETSGTLASQELANAAARAAQPNGQQRGRGGAFRVFIGCLPMHIAQTADVQARQLYQPPSTTFGFPPITFEPSVGLYAVPRTPQAGQESFRVYTLPSTPPKDPFEVRTAAECTGDVRNTSTEALAELRAYFTSGTPPRLWTITAHTAKNGTWYELNPGDAGLVFPLLFCGHIASGTPQDVVGKGWDGMMQPELNYNPAWGLYLIRPQPRQGENPPPPR